MKIVNIEQGTQAWHDFRKKGIGSSDISILLGSYPFGGETPLTLFQDKRSALVDYKDSKAMSYGREEEKKALAVLRLDDPNLRPACAIHSEHDFIRCSFDALGDDLFYEIKSPYLLEILEKALMGDFQDYWEDQIRWQMLVSGLPGNLVVWDGTTPHKFPIERDEQWEQNALKVASDFWNNHVIPGIRPEATDEDYIPVEDQECSQSLQEYYFWSEKEKESKQNKEIAKKRVIDKGPDHDFIVDGIKIYQKENVFYDFEKMKADGINIDLYKKASHPYWMISPKKGSSKTL